MRNYLLAIIVLGMLCLFINSAQAALTVTQTQQLNFGTFSTSSGGTINTSGTTTGDIDKAGAGQLVGTFLISGGTNNQKVTITLLNNIITVNNGTSVATATLSFTSTPPTRLNNMGQATVSVQGTLTAISGQPTGTYSGTYVVQVV